MTTRAPESEPLYPRSWYDTMGMPLPQEYGGGSRSTSSGTSESTSTSTPIAIDTPENEILRGLSGVAAGLANQMNSWANNVYTQTSRVTDQAVGNFFNVSQRMLGVSDNLTNQYNNIFAPQNASLAKEANEYNSAARQKVNMGMAGATQRQAGDAALRTSEDALRSYGINPADGRYAALQKAAAVQNSANVAGAMNQERERTAQVGRDLRRDAVQVGATLPAAIANVNNTAIQANTGASNATLANANTGANLQRISNEFLRTAMDLKLPPTGQNSQSNSRSQQSSMGAAPSSGGGSGGGSSGGGSAPRMSPSGGQQFGGRGDGGGQAWMPQHGNAQPSGGGGRMMMGQPGSAIMRVPGGGARGVPGDYDVSGITNALNDTDFSYLNDMGNSYGDFETGYGSIWGDEGYADAPFNDYGGPDQWGFDSYDFENRGWDDTYGGGGDYQSYGNIDYGSYDQGGWGQNDYVDNSWGNYDNIAYDAGANSVDTGWENTYDTPVETDWGGWGSGNAAFEDYGMSGWAKGGPVDPARKPRQPMPQGGGRVPPQMSPSGGRQVDDVPAMSPGGPARLNADEFVIPRDVALWKGQEFFQKMIDQSRKARMTAPAPGGQPMQPQQPGM